MKKSLLFMCLMLVGSLGFSQIIFYVEEPSPFEGNYNFTYVEADDATWSVPDLNLSENSVQGFLRYAVDNTADPNFGCETIVNPEEIDGNIAVISRGSCEFGLKALNAQNAGAIAVVIVNNVPGEAVGMAGGANGISVTIPVVMISQSDGELLADAIEEGNTTAFIGTKLGLFQHDAGTASRLILRSEAFATPAVTAVDNSEFEVPLGAWVMNYGSENQDAVTLTGEVMLGDAVLYLETSAPVAINSGDSAFITLPTFSQPSYNAGYYDVEYTVNLPVEDESDFDNVVEADFMLTDSLFSYARIDTETSNPNAANFFTIANLPEGSGFSSCIVYRDENASRLNAKGITFGASTGTNGGPLADESFEIRVYEWNDEFENIDDPNYAIGDIDFIIQDEFYFEEGTPNQEMVYVPFSEEFQLANNQRYLFCVMTNSPTVYIGYDSGISYDENIDQYLQPIYPLNSANGWSIGFASGDVPGIGIRMVSNSVGLDEADNNIKITPFPNPANATISIPVGNVSGKAELTMFDITGKMVKSQTVSVGSNGMLTANVADVENGVYVFSLNFESGATSTFRVVVSK